MEEERTVLKIEIEKRPAAVVVVVVTGLELDVKRVVGAVERDESIVFNEIILESKLLKIDPSRLC